MIGVFRLTYWQLDQIDTSGYISTNFALFQKPRILCVERILIGLTNNIAEKI